MQSVLRKYFHVTEEIGALSQKEKTTRHFLARSNLVNAFWENNGHFSEDHMDTSLHFVGKIVEFLKLKQVTT